MVAHPSSTMATFASIVAVFLLLGEGSASIQDHCNDIAYWDEIRYETTTKQCCNTKLQQVCTTKRDQICQDVLELQCEVVAWGECQSTPTSTLSTKCGVKYNNFAHQKCKEVATSVFHIKKVPECKEITKNNCVTDWYLDSNGNKVWAGTETCTPVTWEDCDIVEKTVEFPIVKTECHIDSHIKWSEFVDITTNIVGLESKCEVKKAVNCKHVVVNKCAPVVWQECKMEPMEECLDKVIHTPIQEKIHQKKCLTGDNTAHLICNPGPYPILADCFCKNTNGGGVLCPRRSVCDNGVCQPPGAKYPCSFDDALLDPLPPIPEGAAASPHERNDYFKWKGNIVPYYYGNEYTKPEDKLLMQNIMNFIQSKTCYQFKLVNQAEYESKHCLEIVIQHHTDCDRNRGHVKPVKGTPRVQLVLATHLTYIDGSDCGNTGLFIHEMMHALGVGHTQRRSDRNNHIYVEFENLDKSSKCQEQYRICGDCTLYDEIPYDCGSIMHYGTHECSNDRKQTIVPIDEKCKLNGRSVLKYIKNAEEVPAKDWELLNIIGSEECPVAVCSRDEIEKFCSCPRDYDPVCAGGRLYNNLCLHSCAKKEAQCADLQAIPAVGDIAECVDPSTKGIVNRDAIKKFKMTLLNIEHELANLVNSRRKRDGLANFWPLLDSIVKGSVYLKVECSHIDGQCHVEKIEGFIEETKSSFTAVKEAGRVRSGFLEYFKLDRRKFDKIADVAVKVQEKTAVKRAPQGKRHKRGVQEIATVRGKIILPTGLDFTFPEDSHVHISCDDNSKRPSTNLGSADMDVSNKSSQEEIHYELEADLSNSDDISISATINVGWKRDPIGDEWIRRGDFTNEIRHHFYATEDTSEYQMDIAVVHYN